MIEPAVPTGRRDGVRRGLVAAVVVAVGVLVGPVAAAHGGESTAEVVSRAPAGPGSVAYDVRLEFEDGHPVEGATVTAVAELADGTSVGPVEMAAGPEAGRYATTLEFPAGGTWTVRFSSADPEVTTSVEEVVDLSAPAVPAAPSTTAAGPTTTSAAAVEVVTTAPEATESTDDISSTSTGLWVALAVVAVVVVSGTFLITRRGKRDDQ